VKDMTKMILLIRSVDIKTSSSGQLFLLTSYTFSFHSAGSFGVMMLYNATVTV